MAIAVFKIRRGAGAMGKELMENGITGIYNGIG
jgi:hypothetical protein